MPDKEEQSQKNVKEIINRLATLVLESNHKDTLKDWAGKGYYDGIWRSPSLTTVFGDSMVKRMGDNALRTKLMNPDGKYSPRDVEMGSLMQQYVENANKSFTGASFTDKQLDWIMNRMPHLSQDPKSIVGRVIHQKLGSELYDSMIKKGMRSVKMADEKMFEKHYPDNVRSVRERVDRIISSPAFLAHADYLFHKYNNIDPKSGKELAGEKPRYAASDFNPYIYAADIMQEIYDNDGTGRTVLDVIDPLDFGPDELPPGLKTKETARKAFIEKARQAKAAREFFLNKKGNVNAGQK